jgi:indole-3-glycerol phosphate synthase
MNILSEIIAKKRERVLAANELVPLAQIQQLAAAVRNNLAPHALSNALRRDRINIIAEFKRRSPSKGIIRPDADLVQIVKSYEAGGAAAISVLTEEDYFSGSLGDLRTVKANVRLPVLRKDFVFDEYQVYESTAAGADAILLIVAVLDDDLLLRLRRLAEDELGLDALVEVHTRDEMSRAAASGANLIGVNNRDLRTFEVSLETSLSLAREAPTDAVLISESGLRTGEDLSRLHAAGFRGFLIGETFMRSDDPEQALRNLNKPRNVL